MAIPITGEEQVTINAPAKRVYDLVADLQRMGEWSPECYRVDWVGGITGPSVGAEFVGHNRIGLRRWSVGGKVVTANAGREFAFTTVVGGNESTRWRYRFEPIASGTGTQLTESYELLWAPAYIRVANLFMPRRSMLQRGMQRTLQRIKAAAEAT